MQIKQKVPTLAFLLLLLFVSPSLSQLTITGANQIGAVPLVPTWVAATNSLIAGLAPTTASGNFSQYTGGDANNLTTPGNPITVHAFSSPEATNMAVCGDDGTAGALLIYTLPASTYGHDLTNITVYGGWQDNGRDSQAYTVYYSTMGSPATFTLLATVNYSPSGVPGLTGSANRVIINDANGAAIAKSVGSLKFVFTSPASENGSVGYTAITVQGVAATNLVQPPIVMTVSNQFSGGSFTPTWPIETNSLIAGLFPSSTGSGNFSYEAGVTGLGALTDGMFGDVNNRVSYATCGSIAGQSVTYYLNGATLTNIVVYSGWLDQNRDGQFYNILYSTLATPNTFVPLTSVSHNPLVTGVSANRIAIRSSTSAPLATNVAFITFDFTPQDAGTDYGYSGYAEIILQGTNAAAVVTTGAAQTVFPTSTSDGCDAVMVFNEIMYHP